MSGTEVARRAAHTVEAHYERLQLRYAVSATGDYERLVTPLGNAQAPVHRWFHVKEAYSHLLLHRVLKDVRLDSQRDELTIYDPFSGSGTTLASAGDYGRDGGADKVRATATEINPFLYLLSSVKARAYSEERPPFLLAAKRAVAAISRGSIDPLDAPVLSTFSNRAYFSEDAMMALRMLAAAIERARQAGDPPAVMEALAVCMAAAVEPSSSLRRDGRALRFEASKRPADPIQTFLDRAYEMDGDWFTSTSLEPRVEHGDARSGVGAAVGDVDLVLFSPPYPNNIDYTEVYKLENWQLGLITSHDEFTAQRRRTLRSHPSLRFAEEYDYKRDPIQACEVETMLAPLCEAVPVSRYQQSLIRTIYGYADDMLSVLRQSANRLRPGGHLVYVVGNSYHGNAHGGIVVAADLIIARLAELVGLEVSCLDVARVPGRRRTESAFLRETVVFARKP